MQPENFHSAETLFEPHVDRDVAENFDREAEVLSESQAELVAAHRHDDMQNLGGDAVEFFGDDETLLDFGATESHVFEPFGPLPCLPGDVDAPALQTASVGPGLGFAAGSFLAGNPDAASSSGPTVSKPVQDALFSRALLTNCQTSEILLPWETGFYKDFFSDEPFAQLVPRMPVSEFCNFGDEPEPQQVAQTLAGVAIDSNPNPVFSRYVECKDDGLYSDKQKQLREVAVSKFLVVLKHDLSCSVTGRHILELGTDDQQVLGAHAVIEAVLGIRSPATLVKRASSLLSYLRWFAKLGFVSDNPFTEAFIWDYLQHLKDVGAPATRGDSAMSAFRFFPHFRRGIPGPGNGQPSPHWDL